MNGSDLTAGQLIDMFGLAKNPVGGWTCETHRAHAAAGNPAPASVVSHLLDTASPISYLHRLPVDVMHYFHQGDPVRVIMISAEGQLEHAVLGADADADEQFQVEVPAGSWRALQMHGDGWSLISQAFAPSIDVGHGYEFPSPDQRVALVAVLGTDLSPLVRS